MRTTARRPLRLHACTARIVLLTLCLLPTTAASRVAGQAVRQPPQIGYAFPAGAQQGQTVEVVVGGQRLANIDEVRISGGGVTAEVIDYERPLNQREITLIREALAEARQQAQDANDGKLPPPPVIREAFLKLAEERGITEKQEAAFRKFNQQRSDPKVQVNPQLTETVTLRLSVDADAAPGLRYLRLISRNSLSNPVRIIIGTLAETRESEPNNTLSVANELATLPIVVNGQIMPGDVDHFSFEARRGQTLVVDVRARQLVPYLADAVPGWFQATATLYDSDGRQVVHVDDHQFHPDPIIIYDVPRDGRYTLEVRDSIYRGREDFVYRATIGELPIVTAALPLGGQTGKTTPIVLDGFNLASRQRLLEFKPKQTGINPLTISGAIVPEILALHAADLGEANEQEPNDSISAGRRVVFPLVINGRIDRPGDQDYYRFTAKEGTSIVAEVTARRLGSPLDSLIRITDAAGRQLALNDDYSDASMGLMTHHADSNLSFTIPATGEYAVVVSDAQDRGGSDFAYRLRLDHARPDFDLRVVPSAINARGGTVVPVTVHAVRRDGFSGDIVLSLKDAPEGFALSAAVIPAGQDKVTLTLTCPLKPQAKIIALQLEGRPAEQGSSIVRQAVAADDMMQAFAYQHLVPAEEWLVSIEPAQWPQAIWQFADETPLALSSGGTTRLHLKAPRRPPPGEVIIELHNPPAGLTVSKTTVVDGGIDVELSCDAEKLPLGSRGNIIFNIILLRQPTAPAPVPAAPAPASAASGTPAPATAPAAAPAGPPRRPARVFHGALPAIQFVVK